MKPFSIYHMYRDAFFFLQKPLVNCITEIAKPDMIFLLGASVHRRRSESIFNSSAPTAHSIADCFLLVLIPDLSGKGLHEWQDKIENSCRSVIPATVIVLQTLTFEEWLKEGHRFASAVWQSAARLYDSGNLSRSTPNDIANPVPDLECKRQYTDGLMKAKEFLAGSELFQLRKQPAMAAFMLHQSAEQALRTLLQLGTGYHANTHNIDRLIRYASLISYKLPDIFPLKTEKEKRLFGLLQKAYIDSRYTGTYQVNGDDLLYLTEKIKIIHKIVSDLGKSLVDTPVLSQ